MAAAFFLLVEADVEADAADAFFVFVAAVDDAVDEEAFFVVAVAIVATESFVAVFADALVADVFDPVLVVVAIVFLLGEAAADVTLDFVAGRPLALVVAGRTRKAVGY